VEGDRGDRQKNRLFYQLLSPIEKSKKNSLRLIRSGGITDKAA